MFSTFEKHFKELNFENYKNQNIQCNIKSITLKSDKSSIYRNLILNLVLSSIASVYS